MFKDLLANASFLITTLFIGSQLFKNTGINRLSLIKYRVLLGIIGGISCITLMYYGFNINPGILLDFRNIPEIIVAIIGGSIAVIITAILSITFRLFYFGVSTYSIITSIGIAIVGLGCAFISRLKVSINRKCVSMGIFSLIIRTIVFSLLINDIRLLTEVLVFLWICTVVIGIAVYYLIQYLVTAHNLILKLKESSTKDFLTGLNNTRSFDASFNNSIKNSLEKGEQLSFLMLDIDFFKKVNDTYGHSVGDFILKEFSKIIVSSCRTFDVVSRIGGEEFSVLLPDCPLSKTLQVAERIRRNVENHNFILENHKIIHITVSIGVAIYPDTIKIVDKLPQKADEGLYKAKQSGRNTVCVG
jgi:diguanylate cyclase